MIGLRGFLRLWGLCRRGKEYLYIGSGMTRRRQVPLVAAASRRPPPGLKWPDPAGRVTASQSGASTG
jgi:hypothetical protein